MKENDMFGLALLASVMAGAEIMRIYTDPAQDFGIERKADNSPLTLADKAAHACIAKILAPTELPILSEEGTHPPYEQRQQWQRFWLVDPLDGTKEFIKKNGEFTVNIALIEQGEPVMGLVYLPAQDVLYTGQKGRGAKRINHALAQLQASMPAAGEPFRMNLQAEDLPLVSAAHEDYVIVASRSHLSPETQTFIEDAEKTHGSVRTLSSGSSIKICLVAEGTADAYPRFAPTMEWDTAAGDAVARAAGRMIWQAEAAHPLVYNKEDLHNPWFLVK